MQVNPTILSLNDELEDEALDEYEAPPVINVIIIMRYKIINSMNYIYML